LPVAITEIKKSIPVSDSQFGTINSVFLFAYGTMYAVGGRIIDVMGSRVGYAVMIIWWSLANMFQGLVSSVMGLGIARFFLGAGEGGGFPGSAKVVSEWFPQKERAFAFGIFNTGSALGGIVAPPLLALIINTMGWRWAFIISGLFGLVWVVAWLRIYSHPAKSKLVSAGEKAYIAAETSIPVADEGRRIPWLSLLNYRSVWGLLAIKFLSDAAWFFFIFWLPKYLSDVKGLSITSVGAYAWIPYAFAGAGSFLGGWFSSYLLKRGVSLDLARKICLGISAALLPASLFITEAPLGMVIVFFSMAMFGHQSWATIVQTLAADMFPSKIVGSVAGLMGSVGTYGAMVFSLIIGFVIEEFGYNPAFLVAGVLHPISFVLVFLIIRKIEVVKLN
jgi:ACS family hexuronate transporter-like MFS transporter